MQETWVRSLGREDPLEEEMATHSRILTWKIPWTEEPGGLQSMGSQRGGHILANKWTVRSFHVYQDPSAAEISSSRVICCHSGSNFSLPCLPVSLLTNTNPRVKLHCWVTAVRASATRRSPPPPTSQMRGSHFARLFEIHSEHRFCWAAHRNEGSLCSPSLLHVCTYFFT